MFIKPTTVLTVQMSRKDNLILGKESQRWGLSPERDCAQF